MVETEENVSWAAEKLSSFMGYRGFPPNDKILELHAKAFCRMVYNRNVWEVIRDEVPTFPRPDDDLDDMKRIGVDESTNDVDWLMKTLIEESTEYPLPPVIREIYDRLPIHAADERQRKYGR